jgi:hypothetical protein
MGPVSETMARIYGLIEKHAPALMVGDVPPERAPKPTSRVDFTVTRYEPAQREAVEQMLSSGVPPLKVAQATGIKYNTVLRWSWRMGLKWTRGRRTRALERSAA